MLLLINKLLGKKITERQDRPNVRFGALVSAYLRVHMRVRAGACMCVRACVFM